MSAVCFVKAVCYEIVGIEDFRGHRTNFKNSGRLSSELPSRSEPFQGQIKDTFVTIYLSYLLTRKILVPQYWILSYDVQCGLMKL